MISPFLRSKASVETNATKGIGGIRLVLIVHLVLQPQVGRRRSSHVPVSASCWGSVWGESKVRSLGKETAGETRARHSDTCTGHPCTSLSPQLPGAAWRGRAGWRAEGAFTSHLSKLYSGFLETLQQARVLLLSKLKRETCRVEWIRFTEIQNKKKNECA